MCNKSQLDKKQFSDSPNFTVSQANGQDVESLTEHTIQYVFPKDF